jgi:beta-lactamase superfamily II metal-dependent hydrolase
MYVVDVEGGGATLYVAPSGETLLIDTGNGDAAAPRDASRIMEAIAAAGVKQIDHLIITHYHGDHIGGLAELASRIPIKQFVDHGPNVQPDGSGVKFLPGYQQIYSKAGHMVVKPGDKIPMTGVDIRVVASAGQVIKTALAGAGRPNPYCANVNRIAPDPTENAQSVAMSIVFGRFRVAHLGDLTWNGELDLMCPNNKVGTVDLFMVSHHAQQRPEAMSNSAALVHGLGPRVAISNNGIRKGGQPDAMKVLLSSPGLEDLWQVHFSQLSGQEYTVPGAFISNLFDEPETTRAVEPLVVPAAGQQQPPAPPTHNGQSHFFKVTAREDGTFTVTNPRNVFAKTYRGVSP